jgi:transmembrane sensor
MTDAEDPYGELDMLRRDAWNWVLRITSGDATGADIAELERWCAQSPRHAEAFARASGGWRSFGPAIEQVVRQDPSGITRLSKPPVIGRRAFLGGALTVSAASAAFAVARPPLGLWPSFTELAADYRTAPGERREISLADTISVELNTRTSLSIQPANREASRIELISGETAVATRSKIVEVIASNGKASASSARFNVRYEGSTVCVTCLDGIVDVVQREQSVALHRDQQIVYGARGLEPLATVDAAVVAGWRDGDLYFRDEPLSRVIEEINRYRSGRIVLMNASLGQRRFPARFKIDRLDVVLPQMQVAFGARVRSLPGGIVLVS